MDDIRGNEIDDDIAVRMAARIVQRSYLLTVEMY